MNSGLGVIAVIFFVERTSLAPMVRALFEPSAKEGEVNGGREAGHPVVLAGDVDAVDAVLLFKERTSLPLRKAK